MKKFNWKRYAVHVLASWFAFAIFLGAMTGFAEGSPWIAIGQTQDTRFFYLKNGVTVNQEGNPVLPFKSEIAGVGTIYTRWEFSCKKKQARLIEVGESLESMTKVNEDWITPVKDSSVERLVGPVCSFGW